jgi:hypothetical protein
LTNRPEAGAKRSVNGGDRVQVHVHVKIHVNANGLETEDVTNQVGGPALKPLAGTERGLG